MKLALTAFAALSLVGASAAYASVAPSADPTAAPAAQATTPRVIEAQYRSYYRGYPYGYYGYYPYDRSFQCQEDLGYGRQGQYGCQ